MKTYFYDDEVKRIKGKEKYIVYAIKHKGDYDIAERKVKTFAYRLNRKLAGGYFSENSKPYNLKEDYFIVNVPYSTRIRPYDKKDKFIMGLIEQEANMEYTLL